MMMPCQYYVLERCGEPLLVTLATRVGSAFERSFPFPRTRLATHSLYVMDDGMVSIQ